MGADFSNRWLSVGDGDDPVACDRAARHLREALTQAGYQEVAREQDAERSLVVAPAGAGSSLATLQAVRRRQTGTGSTGCPELLPHSPRSWRSR